MTAHAAALPGKLTLVPLVAATYFMVSGGPYGLEELVQQAGYGKTLLVLVLTPLVWSLPTALMVGELSSALPEEGGYYVWVRRALGPFWGFQEAWLSLASTVFDMAIYPTIFALYLTRLWPELDAPNAVLYLGAPMIAACTLWNLRGARAVANGAVAMTVVLLAPFAVLAGLALLNPAANGTVVPGTAQTGIFSGILIAMWNYMGWDSASTVAGEVRNPQREYPRAMMAAVALVAITYLVPVAATWRAGIDPSGWTTGAWAEAAGAIGGPALATAVSLGGILCGVGIFNSLMMSNTRLPLAMATDGMLPAVFARTDPKTGAPWVAILALAVAWTACLGLGFQRLVELDVLLYGLSLILEFIALVVLRIREPRLPRPYRVPGGLIGAVAVGVAPTALIAAAVVGDRGEQVGGINALALGTGLALLGPLLYWMHRAFRSRRHNGSQ